MRTQQQAALYVLRPGQRPDHTRPHLLGGSMFHESIHAESSTLSPPGSSPLSEPSLRDRITATIIREEAAESILPGIHGEAELAALVQVFNRYQAHWWLQHLSLVGADPATYWRTRLGDEIRAATRSKKSTSQRKKVPWWFFGWRTTRVTYELCDLDLAQL